MSKRDGVDKNSPSIFRAILHGGGRDVICQISATEIALLKAGITVTIEHSLGRESIELRDGAYTLTVNGERIRMIRRQSTWIASGPA